MPRWMITTNLASDHTPDSIEADYYKVTEDSRFIEFKDINHKVVYMVASDHVVSVTRHDER